MAGGSVSRRNLVDCEAVIVAAVVGHESRTSEWRLATMYGLFRIAPNSRHYIAGHSLGYSIGRSSNMSSLAWLAPILANAWNFMVSGELRVEQIRQAGLNPQRFYLALSGSRSAVRIRKLRERSNGPERTRSRAPEARHRAQR
jgi:hypothetical protein